MLGHITVVAFSTSSHEHSSAPCRPKLQVAESGKAAISSQKVKKPGVLADKTSVEALKRRPSAVGTKVLRPDVRADKANAPVLQKKPGATSIKLGDKATDLKR